MRIEIWSDVVCPWCYVGKRRFESALARFDHADQVEVVWRAFELDPSAPAVRDRDYAEHLASKYRVTAAEAAAMIERMVAAGAAEGLDMRFDLARPGNTFDTHRLLHLALERGVQGALKERLLAATFTEGAAIGEADVLAGLATDAGLDAEEVAVVLDGDRYAADVRGDERRAAAFGITAVPFFVIDETYGVPGAQPPDVLLAVLEQAWAETHPLSMVSSGGDAPGCTGDSCEIG
jgi:predicted DsbA family dithiol-disulfide isomerase